MTRGSRQELLSRIVAEVAQNGLGDRSLRDLAAAIGTSHRMLLYHFGSRHGLIIAIVTSVEQAQRDLMVDIDTDTLNDPVQIARKVWTAVTSPEARPFVQLFYEAIAYASRHGGAEFTTPWLATVEQTAARLGVAPDPIGARLAIAVIRGLLIDFINNDAPHDVDQAFERFLALATPPPTGATQAATNHARQRRR